MAIRAEHSNVVNRAALSIGRQDLKQSNRATGGKGVKTEQGQPMPSTIYFWRPTVQPGALMGLFLGCFYYALLPWLELL